MERITLLRFYDSNKSIGWERSDMDTDTALQLIGTMKIAEKYLVDFVDNDSKKE